MPDCYLDNHEYIGITGRRDSGRAEFTPKHEGGAEGKSVSDFFDTDDCTLAVRDSDLLLTCGADFVPVPLPGE
jgi:hypothetical protein